MAEAAVQKNNIIRAINEYGKQLFLFIRSRVNTVEDAEDILQDVWLQLSNQEETDTLASVSGWLYRVAKNKITDSFKKKKNELIDDYNFLNEDGDAYYMEVLLATDNTPETEYLRQLFWEELFIALKELPEKQRKVFELNELENVTLQQIADENGENIKTIISRKRYAVQYLRKRLDNLYNDFLAY